MRVIRSPRAGRSEQGRAEAVTYRPLPPLTASYEIRPNARAQRYHDHRSRPDRPVRRFLRGDARRVVPAHRQPRSGGRTAHGPLSGEVHLDVAGFPKVLAKDLVKGMAE